MSLWVSTPELRRRADGVTLFRPINENWSAERATWDSDDHLTLLVRRLPGNHIPPLLSVRIACTTETAQIENGALIALSELESALDRKVSLA